MEDDSHNIRLSDHARKRMQQRGIPIRAVELLTRFGKCRYVRGGARSFMFNRAKLANARKKLRATEFLALEKALRGAFVLVAEGGTVITTAWQTRRLRN